MVEEAKTAENKSFQKDWSLGLICGIVIMSVAFMRSTPVNEDGAILQIVLIAPIVTILLVPYLFVYRGRESRTARVIFIIFLVLSLLIIAGFMYLVALAGAFKN
ncbi:hypothetical protein SAMN05421820_107285 [Pedobacter steynii]|uniref:Uncharacterized protein n=1 Tax=Pedobacter steynii TaxID=430522 RepID=A0A1H0B2G0_9SPHI|nr:hypothetical protein [Pedobacter steynii]NQX41180.1 hypothetical protein [Pedobacter steynii]SDN39841.1 hypothetical protein SAMN05421820_107285 [Pedobacter steynii]